MDRLVHSQRVQLSDRDNIIALQKEKLVKGNSRIMELERLEMELRMEVEKKNIQLDEMNNRFITYSPLTNKRSDSTNNTLYSECPEILNKQIESLMDQGKSMRVEI